MVDLALGGYAHGHRFDLELPEGPLLTNLPGTRLLGALFALCALSGLMELSCINPFAPRLGTDASANTCNDLTQIEDVLCTFRNAYNFKDTTLYGTIIAPEFTFSYRDYDRGIDVSWGRDDEMRTTYGLFQSVQSLTLIWNNEISSDSGTTRRTIIRGFDLTVTFNASDIERVNGYANLTFERPTASDPWRIVFWRDESNF